MADIFRILAADKLADEGLAFIREQHDCELVSKPGLSEDELAAIAGEHDAMIVRSGVTVTAKVLARPGRLKVIARAGVGVDNIDLDAATDAGILVLNTAEANTISTAEHAFALLMATARRIPQAHGKVAAGGWDRDKFKGRQLAGKTLGIVGFGRIGQAIATRALAFDMSVIAYDPFINAETMMDGKVRMYRDFADLVPHADALTFHVPLNEQTRGMMNTAMFAKARKGVIVINASRGGVIDETDLVAALDAGQCGGAGLDVYADEPPPTDHPLRKHDKVTLTPHLGASTVEAQQAVSVVAAESVLMYLRGEGIRGAVNAGGLRVDLDPLQTRFVDLSRRMAQLISPMCTRGIADVTIELVGKPIHAASGTIERTILVNLLKGHLDVPLNIINVAGVARQRGITLRAVTLDEAASGLQLSLVIKGPPGSVDGGTDPQDHTRRIVGRVMDDLRPRVTEINGYHMDMVPAGTMLLLQNEDRPGMIGLVGTEMANANVNIADMAISRRPTSRGGEAGKYTALMLLKLDSTPGEALLNRLRHRPGILKAAVVELPAETPA
jgi:D-3-phosphoglycerate dehydrogenase